MRDDATRLLGEEFKSRAPTVSKPTTPPTTGGGDDGDDEPLPTVIVVEGLSVRIEDAGRYVLMQQDGRDIRMPIEEYREKMVAELRAEAPDAEAFRQIWIEPPRRRTLIDNLLGKGFAPRVIQHVDGLLAYDEYDVLASAAYEATPRTRDDRRRPLRAGQRDLAGADGGRFPRRHSGADAAIRSRRHRGAGNARGTANACGRKGRRVGGTQEGRGTGTGAATDS